MNGGKMVEKKPKAIVIGAGFTGCAIAHDLALRGFSAIVFERGEIASGTSGRTHGLLHSGGRYCVEDQEAAIECIQENIILRKIAAQCIEPNGGLFIALEEKDLTYREEFIKGAQACGIPIEEITPRKALELEPNVNPELLTAFTIPDGTFDPLRLALAFAASAKESGIEFKPYHEIKGLLVKGSEIKGVKVLDRTHNTLEEYTGDIVINATGAWAGQIANLAQIKVPVTPTPGVMVAYDERLIQRVINRLDKPGDGDILIPQRRMVVIGTTSFEVTDVDYIPVVEEQVTQMYKSAIALVPAVARTKPRGIYMSARPLIGSSLPGRSISRTFKCYDHKDSEGIEGFVTVTGGKATTCRIMAEKTVDLVCQKLGIHTPCSTKEKTLSSYRNYYKF